MTPYILDAERDVFQGIFHHPGSPMLRWNIKNTAVEETSNGALRLSKATGHQNNKIDGAICLVMALAVSRMKTTIRCQWNARLGMCGAVRRTLWISESNLYQRELNISDHGLFRAVHTQRF